MLPCGTTYINSARHGITALGCLCLMTSTKTDGLERFPWMCRNSGRMIEIATERTPTSAQLGRQISKLARTLRGNRFGLSGGASLVAMVQAADLRQRHDSAHFSWLKQARLGRVLKCAVCCRRKMEHYISHAPSPQEKKWIRSDCFFAPFQVCVIPPLLEMNATVNRDRWA